MIKYDGMKSEVRTGTAKHLPAGPYVAKVISAKIEGNEPSQKLAVYLDIAEGQYKDFYMKKYRSQKEKGGEYKVTYKGVLRLWIPNPDNKAIQKPEKVISTFNDMIGRFEASNPGFQWDGDENKLTGLLIGISVQEDSYNGFTFTKPSRFEIVDAVREGRVPVMEPVKRDEEPDPTPAPMVDQRSGMQMVDTEQLPWDQKDQPW